VDKSEKIALSRVKRNPELCYYVDKDGDISSKPLTEEMETMKNELLRDAVKEIKKSMNS
jgi:hypothetical protein